jgi:hypothetical protein
MDQFPATLLLVFFLGGSGMSPDKLALLFYMLGSVMFMIGSIIMWFK